MRAPEVIETQRLILRRPVASDAEDAFERYASDPDVTEYLAWPTHTTPEDSLRFIEFSDGAWNSSPGGPYLIELRATGMLLGSAGFAFEGQRSASVGYVLAKDAWGHGYATEALRALLEIAAKMGISRLRAYCHSAHRATTRVLEKCDFAVEARHVRHTIFPNLGTNEPQDVLCYVAELGNSDVAPCSDVGLGLAKKRQA